MNVSDALKQKASIGSIAKTGSIEQTESLAHLTPAEFMSVQASSRRHLNLDCWDCGLMSEVIAEREEALNAVKENGKR